MWNFWRSYCWCCFSNCFTVYRRIPFISWYFQEHFRSTFIVDFHISGANITCSVSVCVFLISSVIFSGLIFIAFVMRKIRLCFFYIVLHFVHRFLYQCRYLSHNLIQLLRILVWYAFNLQVYSYFNILPNCSLLMISAFQKI